MFQGGARAHGAILAFVYVRPSQQKRMVVWLVRCSSAVLRRLALLVLVALLCAPRAEAQPTGCAPDLLRWADRCTRARTVALRVVACPSHELAVLSASVDGGAAVRVEFSLGGRGFRVVGAHALSPVGEFPDWSRAPPALRDAFEQVVACAQDAPPRQMRGGAVPVIPTLSRRAHARVPWLLALAALLALAGARGIGWGAWRRGAGIVLATGASTLLLRASLHPRAYFHQNGQGALWIDALFTSEHHPYGPGFSELFGFIAQRAPAAPERAVFAAQSLLAATQPACAWWIARAVGANPWVAGALGLAVALDPALGRGARSEAYFAVGTSLCFLALVALTRAAQSAWGPAVAGLLLAQAVRVHPALWVPAALVPLSALLLEGSLKDRARAVAIALGVTGAVVVLSSAPAILAVLRSDLAAHWMSTQSRGASDVFDTRPAALGVACVALALATPARWRAALPVALAVVAFTAMRLTDNFTRSGSPPWIVAAYARTFLPVALAALAALVTALHGARRGAPAVGVGLAVILVALTNRDRAALTRLPTDALELQRAWAWRERLPRDAKVFSVTRAGRYVLVLPIHGGARGLRAVALDPEDPPPDLREFGPDVFYYRASTCSAPNAAAWCDAFERAHRLAPVAVYELPAVPSMRHLVYQVARIRVGLYRVTD